VTPKVLTLLQLCVADFPHSFAIRLLEVGSMKWISLLLLVPLGASQAASQVASDKVIVPGVRIGKWALQMTIDDLLRANGFARRTLFMGGVAPVADHVRDFTLFGWVRNPVAAATADQKNVDALMVGLTGVLGHDVAGPQYETNKGIGFRATRPQVLKAYGKPTAETAPQAGEVRLIYDEIGIAFRFDVGGRMRTIDIFPPRRAKSLWKF
jgi:hypothetical protein